MLTSKEHSKIHGSAKRKPPVREKKKIFICECCGKEYLAFDTGQNRFCSKNCLLKYYVDDKQITEGHIYLHKGTPHIDIELEAIT